MHIGKIYSKSKSESYWLVIALRKYITSCGPRTFCNGPETVEIRKCYWPIDQLTNKLTGIGARDAYTSKNKKKTLEIFNFVQISSVFIKISWKSFGFWEHHCYANLNIALGRFLQRLPCNVIGVKYLRLGMICGGHICYLLQKWKKQIINLWVGKIYLLLRVNWIRDNISTAREEFTFIHLSKNPLIWRVCVFKSNFHTLNTMN